MGFFKKNKTLLIVIIIICGIIIMWGRSIISRKVPGIAARMAFFGKKAPEEPTEEIVPVKVTKVSKTNYKDTIVSFGTIKGFGEIPIKFKETGNVSKFHFKEGEEIKGGDIVVSQTQQEEQLKLEYSQIEYGKNKTLYELGAITADKLRQAELELESTKLGVERRNFYAPSNGFMGTRKVNEGELVGPEDVVATFLDISSVVCEVGIIERDMGKVKVGQDVEVAVEAFADKVFDGIVDSVSPMIEGRSRTQTVKILIPNKDNLIKPGMFARTKITIFEKEDAIVIPQKVLYKTDTGYVVFGVVRGEGKTEAGFEEATAKIIPVEVERATEDLALISAGLAENQEVVLETPQAKSSIKDGGKIEIIGEE